MKNFKRGFILWIAVLGISFCFFVFSLIHILEVPTDSGTILYGILIGGLRSMPGWAIGNLIIGFNLCLWIQLADHMKSARNKFFVNILTCIMIFFLSAFGILGVKSIVDSILYGQSFMVSVATNFNSFVAEAVVLIIVLIICSMIEKVGMYRR